METSRGDDGKMQVGEEMCGEGAIRRAVERRKAVESCGNEERRISVSRRKGKKL